MYQPYQQPYPQQPFQPSMPSMYGQPQQAVPTQQPQPQRPPIAGRVVAAPHEVAPNDVPMDGSCAYFPMADGSAVIAKAWRPDGTIGTVRYVPEQTDLQDGDAVAQPTIMDVMNRLDSMEDLIRGSQKPAQRARTRKGGDDD